ncbi:MAG TPA: ATP-binding protein [Solirubrobacteraceae bacterium]|nr:ATP-binding protein [Solirubrobacteraceae bacterium]
MSELDMLAGRAEQLTDIVSAAELPGQHIGLYGERGVGKTSLATVLAEYFGDAGDDRPVHSVVVNCSSDEDFSSLWREVFAELPSVPEDRLGAYTPEYVRRRLQQLDTPALIVIDELDRLDNDDALTALADTIKTLSDHRVSSTLVLVGVGRSMGDLIGEHASIVRALVQIEMPRMRSDELAAIVTTGCSKAGISAKQNAIADIVALSEGLPHYTHLLALHAGLRTVQDDRDEITATDVQRAIPKAVDRHTIESDYQLATRSARKDALFSQVLLACALAPKNQLGFFTSGAIRDPLEAIAGRRIEIPAFSNHLSQFLEPERGAVLQREGTSRRYFYRFADPIFQPYVILRGLSEDLISDLQLRQIQNREHPEAIPGDYETGRSQQLF